MIGASAAISGQMAAAIRFVFERGGPLGAIRSNDPTAYFVPAQPLRNAFAINRFWFLSRYGSGSIFSSV